MGSGAPFEGFDTTTSLKDKVYEAIKTGIILGRFRSGDTLNILELSGAMNISAAPIREALSMLHRDKFVVLTPRKKAVVAPVMEGDFRLVVELRMLLEPYAARRSLGRIPAEDLASVRVRLREALANPDDMAGYVASDLALHELLHAHAGSPVLSEILVTVKEHSLRLRYSAEEHAPGDGEKRAFVIAATNEHLTILDALERGDPDEVAEKVLQHLGKHMERTHRDGTEESILKG